MIELKSPAEVGRMRAAGLVVADTLARLREAARPGVSTGELDELAETSIREAGGVPSFLGYHGFPASICASVGAQVVHGIPSRSQVLADGDLLSIDCGAIVDGWHGDAAVTVAVGTVDPALAELSRVTEQALWHGIAAARVGGRLSDIGAAVEGYVRAQGPYGTVRDYTGHGIGREMHQSPAVPNQGRPGRGLRLRPGLCLAVEPMVTLGSGETRTLADDWTVVTADGSVAAHWEHTFALTDDGPWVLTAHDGGAAGLAGVGAVAAAR